MSLTAPQPIDLATFLDWEQGQDLRYEFDGTRIVAMTGGTAAHAMIQRNLALAIGGRLRGRSCQFIGSDLKIEVAGRIRYPDGFVVCSRLGARTQVVRDPVVIFEVLSDSTQGIDLITKNHEYAATASVRRYVALSQTEVGGTMFERIGGDWIGHLIGASSVLTMPEIGLDVPVIEFYEGVEFPAPATSAP